MLAQVGQMSEGEPIWLPSLDTDAPACFLGLF